ncbi:glycosyltransferase family 25 protein [Alteromonas sediminis]|uniref:Glycosyltransferase family 25 protein n=1 Tax=Alteromonas sediminis TaxID=2259342 RepID=A0A3N5Y0U4_9ALTE|nr:glycosyltransferase family 25 protein [Alteromonas sediminis]RPJ67122.1 glycosyltransferase family 25 protein [Alteromonas sediminis]
MQNYNIFLINLDKSVERLRNADEQFKRLHIAYERMPAVYGPDLSETELNVHYSAEKNRKIYHKQLNVGEVGCYLSHRKVWQAIVEQNLDFAIVLEDDFSLNANFLASIAAVAAVDVEWDYIKLAEYPEKRKALSSREFNGFSLITYDKIPARTGAQAVSLSGAKKLLATSEQFGRPIDIDLQYIWEKKLRLYGLKPYPVNLKSQFASEIDEIGKRCTPKVNFFAKAFDQIRFKIMNHLYRNKLGE